MGAICIPHRKHVLQREANGDRVQLGPLKTKRISHNDERRIFVAYFWWNRVSNHEEIQRGSELTNFVKMHTHLNQCSEGRFAICVCHLVDKNNRGFETFEKPLTDV